MLLLRWPSICPSWPSEASLSLQDEALREHAARHAAAAQAARYLARHQQTVLRARIEAVLSRNLYAQAHVPTSLWATLRSGTQSVKKCCVSFALTKGEATHRTS